MARIPVYGEPQQAERPLSLPSQNPELSLSNFGGGQAAENVTGQAVGLVGDIQKEEQRKYQEQYQHGVNLQALEISNQLTAEATRAKNALTQRQGKAAIGGRDETLAGYDKFFQDIEKNISNDDVKRVAYAHFLQNKEHLDSFATPYESGQIKEYDNNELTSAMKTQQESAATDPTPANVSVASMSQKLSLEEYAKRNGMGPEWLTQKQQEVGSATHLAALHSLVASGNDLYAKRFFDDNKAEFVGNDAINAQKLVEDGSYRGQAQREVARIFGGDLTTEGPPTAPTEKETYAAVDKIEDPKLQDMVRQRVRTKWEDIKRVDADALRADTTEAANVIEANPSLDAIPVDLYERLPLGTRSYLNKRILELKKGAGPQAGSDAYLGYVRESAIHPDTFVKRNFAAMRDEITGDEAKELTKDQAKIISGDERMARKRNGFLTVEEIGKSRLKALNVDDKDQVDQFMTALNRDYDTWLKDPKNAGRGIDPTEAQLLVSRLLGRKKAWWQMWGRAETAVFKNIQDVPDADRISIEKALRDAGEVPTEGRIIEIYGKGK